MKEGSVGIGSGYPLTLALPSCTIPTFDSACNSGTVNLNLARGPKTGLMGRLMGFGQRMRMRARPIGSPGTEPKDRPI